MKRCISLVIAVFILAAVFSVPAVDAAFENVPSIFIGDGEWYKDAIQPLITRGEHDYVPIDVFDMFDYVSVTVPKTDNILIHNTVSGEYISILFGNRSAAVNGTIVSSMGTFMENGTYYVDAAVVTEAVGLKFESQLFDDGEKAVRISDDDAEYSLFDLIAMFLSVSAPDSDETLPETEDEPTFEDTVSQKKIYILCSQSNSGVNKPLFSANEILQNYGLSYTMFIYDPSRVEDVIRASTQGEYGVYISYYGDKTVTEAVDSVNEHTKKITHKETHITLDVYGDDAPHGYYVVEADFTVNGVLSAKYVYGQITEYFETHDSCTLYLEDCWNSEQMIILLAGLDENKIITQNLAGSR